MVDFGAATTEPMRTSAKQRRTPMSRALVGDMIQFIDFVLVIGASIGVAYFYHYVVLVAIFDPQYYAAAGIIGATGLTALLRRDGYYDFEKLLAARSTLRSIGSRWILVVFGLLAFGFALKISENFSRFWLVLWSAVSILSIFMVRRVAAIILRRMMREGGVLARRVAVVGSTTLGQKFAEQTGAIEAGVSIVGVFDAGVANGDDQATAAACKGDMADVATAARNGEIDDIVIALPRASQEDMGRVVRRLSTLPVSIAICPNIHWLDHAGGAITAVGGAKVLSLYRRPLEGWGGIVKTMEDMILGGLALIFATPILLLIAAVIKLENPNEPVLFSQKRHGFNHSVFRIIKFRTMTVAEDGDVVEQAKPNDPRITRVGGFLRRYSLDELPQLINVIRGEMSLVGPRPHALAHNHQYARAIENYSGRHKVKPGITGWAQVNGFRGETSENEMMEDRVRYDLAYVDNWSLWFDIKILFLTVKAVAFPQNAV